MKHKVFARYLGKTAFVNSFKSSVEAANLVSTLRRKYNGSRATFTHSADNLNASVKWNELRVCLNEWKE